MNEYKVTITIESDEEIYGDEFYVNADSLDEAMENIKNKLDVD